MAQPFSYLDAPSMIGSWLHQPNLLGITAGNKPGLIKYQASVLGIVREGSGYDIAGRSFDLKIDGTTYSISFSGSGLLSLSTVISTINTAVGATVAKNENGFLRIESTTLGESSFVGIYTDPASSPKDVLYKLGLFSGTESRGGEPVEAPQVDWYKQRIPPKQLAWSEGESISSAAFNRSIFQLALNQDKDHGLLEYKRLAGLKEVSVVMSGSADTFDLVDSVFTGLVGPSPLPDADDLENVVAFLDSNYSEVVIREYVNDGAATTGVYSPVGSSGGEGILFTASSSVFSASDATQEKYLVGTHANLGALSGSPLKVIEYVSGTQVRVSNVSSAGDVVSITATPSISAQKQTLTPWTVRVDALYDAASPSDRVEKVQKTKVASTTISRVDLNNRVVCAGASFTSAGLLAGDLVTISGHSTSSPYGNNGSYRVKTVVDDETLELLSSDWGSVVLNPVGTLGSLTIKTDGDFFYNVRAHLDKTPAAGTYKVLYKSMSTLRGILDADVGVLASAQLRHQQEADDVIERAILAIIGPSTTSISSYLYNDARYSLERAYGLVTAEHYTYDESDQPGRHRFVNADAIQVTNTVLGRKAIYATSSADDAAVAGRSTSAGLSYGVSGFTSSSTDESAGVSGESSGGSGKTFGVWGMSFSPTLNAAGVYGISYGNGPTYGVRGHCESGITDASSCAVRGDHEGGGYGGYFSAASGVGLYSTVGSANKAIYGNNSGTGYGVYGESTSTGVGGWFGSNSGYALITGSGNVGIGVAAPTAKLHIAADGTTKGITLGGSSDSSSAPAELTISRSRSGGGNVVSGDVLGGFVFQGIYSGSGRNGSQIYSIVDGTPSATSMPTRIAFYTSPSGSVTPVERMRISENGCVNVGSSYAPSVLLTLVSGTQYQGISLRNNTNEIAKLYGISSLNESGALELRTGGSLRVGLYGDNREFAFASYLDSSSVGEGSYFTAYRSRSGGAVGASDTLGGIALRGKYDATTYASGAVISGVAAEAWTSSAKGCELRFYTTAIGSNVLSTKLKIEHAGRLAHTPVVVINGTGDQGIRSQAEVNIYTSGSHYAYGMYLSVAPGSAGLTNGSISKLAGSLLDVTNYSAYQTDLSVDYMNGAEIYLSSRFDGNRQITSGMRGVSVTCDHNAIGERAPTLEGYYFTTNSDGYDCATDVSGFRGVKCYGYSNGYGVQIVDTRGDQAYGIKAYQTLADVSAYGFHGSYIRGNTAYGLFLNDIETDTSHSYGIYVDDVQATGSSSASNGLYLSNISSSAGLARGEFIYNVTATGVGLSSYGLVIDTVIGGLNGYGIYMSGVRGNSGNTYPFYVSLYPSGTAYMDSAGTWHPPSSRNIKREIEDLSSQEAIDVLLRTKAVSYRLIEGFDDSDRRRLGFIAEDVPDLVATKDRKTITDTPFIAVLTKAVQDLYAEVQSLKKQLSAA